MQQMTTENAMAIIREACADFKGVLADHQRIQAAIQTVEAALAPKPAKPKKEK